MESHPHDTRLVKGHHASFDFRLNELGAPTIKMISKDKFLFHLFFSFFYVILVFLLCYFFTFNDAKFRFHPYISDLTQHENFYPTDR